MHYLKWDTHARTHAHKHAPRTRARARARTHARTYVRTQKRCKFGQPPHGNVNAGDAVTCKLYNSKNT